MQSDSSNPPAQMGASTPNGPAATPSAEFNDASQDRLIAIRRAMSARPTCTHRRMDKLYGNYDCKICNRVPAMGFVYACVQDEINPPESSHRAKQVLENVKSFDNPDAADLKSLGFDNSVINAAEEGHYTPEQLKTLVDQKLNVKVAIAIAGDRKDASQSKQATEAGEPSEKLISALEKSDPKQYSPWERYKPSRDERSKAKQKPRQNNRAYPCDFRCCHSCRPYSRDRTFISLDEVLQGKIQPPERWIPEFMPVHDARIVRNLGLRIPRPHPAPTDGDSSPWTTGSSFQTSSSSDENEAPAQSSFAERALQLRTRPGYENLKLRSGKDVPETRGFSSSVKNSMKDLVRYRLRAKEDLPDDQMDALFAQLHSVENDGTVDMELWKDLNNRVLQDASAIKLPESHGDDDLEEGRVDDEEEKQVEGGVALTEEAIENNLPDIIMNA